MANDKSAFKDLHLGQGAGAASGVLGMSWKTVTIAGTTGIMMGASGGLAGMVYATDSDQPDDSLPDADVSVAQHDVPRDEPVVAESDVAESDVAVLPPLDVPLALVDDNLPFGDAFADARSQVGPGGIFDWHGNLFNTYYVEEWDAMSQDERIHFAQLVPAAQDAEPIPQPDIAEDVAPLEADVHAVSDDDHEFTDDDVRILGIDDFDREAPLLFGMDDDGADVVSIIDLSDDPSLADPDVLISPDDDLLVLDDVHVADDPAVVDEMQHQDDILLQDDVAQEDQQEITGDLSAFDLA